MGLYHPFIEIITPEIGVNEGVVDIYTAITEDRRENCWCGESIGISDKVQIPGYRYR